MKLPFGLNVDGQYTYVLKLNKSLDGLKQSISNWSSFLTQGLVDRNFIPSKIDPCIYDKENYIILIYIDDCIVLSKTETVLGNFIESLQSGKKIYILTDEGETERNLGVYIYRTQKSITTK